jgi:hypothetical protein
MKLTFKQYIISEVELSANFPIHKELEQSIWDKNVLRTDVKAAMKKIAKEFEKFLESPDVKVVDVIFTGSLANFNYTKYSDVDIHLILDAKSSDNDQCVIDLREFLMAKKNLWNQTHNIVIHKFPVEVYAQLADESNVASGVYSLTKDEWITKPTHISKKYNKYAVEVKAKHLAHAIDKVIEDKVDDSDVLKKIMEKIKTMRKSGLEKGGEMSEENLAFKVLRNNGYLEKLTKYRTKVRDKTLSL